MFDYSRMDKDDLWRYKSDIVTLVSQVMECVGVLSNKYKIPYAEIMSDFANTYNGVSSDDPKELLETLKKGLHLDDEETEIFYSKMREVVSNDE